MFSAARDAIDAANGQIASGAQYKALKETLKLTECEEEPVAA